MTPPREIFVVAGEASGDLHAAHVIRALKARDPDLIVRGYGGPRMAAAGAEILYDLASDGVMGIFPVVKAFPRLRRLLLDAVADIAERRPAAVLLTDYPGFNLRLGERVRALGVPVIQYVCPTVWAWARWRTKRVARACDTLLAILPFEAEAFAGTGLDVRYVGHPLHDHLAGLQLDEALIADLRADTPGPIIGLFPGSRSHVVKSLGPVLANAARILAQRPAFQGARFLWAFAKEEHRELIGPWASDADWRSVPGHPYEVMRAMDFAASASGTATLEIAGFDRPFVLAYRTSAPMYALARALVRVPHIGLVNLIDGTEVTPEHVDWRDRSEGIAADLARLVENPTAAQEQRAGLARVRAALASEGSSYERVAEAVLEQMPKKPQIHAE